jgi:hypothetical protein
MLFCLLHSMNFSVVRNGLVSPPVVEAISFVHPH